jgi:hypothetical protein
MNEHDALNVLDRRMRAAGAELHRAIAAAIDQGSPTVTGADDQPSTLNQRSTAEDSATVIRLDEGMSPRPSPRRWLWAAAAVVIAAGVAGVIVVGRGGDGDSPPATTGDQRFLVPGWLPSGWGPVAAERTAGPSGPWKTGAVYGSSNAADPWRGTVVAILRTDATAPLDTTEAETVAVAGHQATIEETGGTWVVTVALEDQTLLVSGRGVGRDTVVGVAAAAAADLPIEPALAGGLVPIAEGLVDPSAGGVYVRYGSESGSHSVTIAQRPGQQAELGLIRFLLPDGYKASQVTVRGQPALRLTEDAPDVDGPDIVQWVEPPGHLVTVSADGLADGELNRLIEQLRPSTNAEIDELVDTYEPPATTTPLQAGEIVVAEGDRGSNHWRVTAREDRGSTYVDYEDDYTGMGFATEPVEMDDDGAVAVEGLELEVSVSEALDARGEAAVIGVADPAITEVVAEAAGQPPLPVELHRHDELTRTVIVGWLPRPYLEGEVIGRDSNGQEVARTPLGP